MDWMKTFIRGQWAIHIIFLLIVVMGLSFTLYTLRLNTLHVTEEDRVIKINSLLHYLKTDGSFEKIGKYLGWAEVDKSHEKMKELTKKIIQTEELVEVKVSKSLNDSIKGINKFINSGSSISNPGDALKILKNKVSSLHDFANTQNYKNVSAIAQRMSNRISQLDAKSIGTSVIVGYLNSDLVSLNRLVDNSTLDNLQKTSLKNRFASMSNEIELMLSLNTKGRDLKSHVTQATLALGQWVIDVENQTRDLKGSRISKQNNLVTMLAVGTFLILLSWIGLAYMFRWQKSKIALQVETEVKNVIEKGIIADQRFMMDHYSESMRENIVRLLDELKIKLNLGSMLHEGLPFAGCMINQEFKLSWYNHLFMEQLYLSDEEIRSDSFNWDYVRDYLNLDEDPIYEALVNKIAGIYSVKVRQDEMTPSQPYEMYVTPITVNREDKVMVFFYPLVAVKEAIENQVGLTRTLIENFIADWRDEKLDPEKLKIFEKKFKSSDLDRLNKLIVDTHQRIEAEKSECFQTIRSMEKDLEGQDRLILELKTMDEKQKVIIKNEFKIAAELQESFNKSVASGESLVQINRSILQQNDEIKADAQKLVHENSVFIKRNKEVIEIFTQLESVRLDYKKLKLELLEVKAKLISINNSLFGQLPPLDDQQQKLAIRYKDELARLDFNVVTLDKKLTQLDVLIAKMHMMHDRNQPEQVHLNLQTTQKDHEQKEELIKIQKTLAAEEARSIHGFEKLNHLMEEDLRMSSKSDQLLSKGLDQFLS